MSALVDMAGIERLSQDPNHSTLCLYNRWNDITIRFNRTLTIAVETGGERFIKCIPVKVMLTSGALIGELTDAEIQQLNEAQHLNTFEKNKGRYERLVNDLYSKETVEFARYGYYKYLHGVSTRLPDKCQVLCLISLAKATLFYRLIKFKKAMWIEVKREMEIFYTLMQLVPQGFTNMKPYFDDVDRAPVRETFLSLLSKIQIICIPPTENLSWKILWDNTNRNPGEE